MKKARSFMTPGDKILSELSQGLGHGAHERVCNRCVVPQGLSGILRQRTEFAGDFTVVTGACGLQFRPLVRSCPRSQGFSLVELMVVVTIIAVVSALVLPTAVQGMRERRTQQAAVSVLDIVRETRSRAMYRGVAHTLRVQSPSGGPLSIDAFEGTSSSCRLSRFGGGTFDAATQLYSLNFGSSTFTRDGIVGQISSPVGLSYLQICFTPLGVAYFSTSAIPDGTTPSALWLNNSSLVGSGGNFVIDIYQSRAGADAGVRRRVVIPLAGVPRLRS